MRILLTGATGSIGSSVLQALVDGKHELTCPVRSLSKVANPNLNPHVHYVQINDSLDDFTKFNQLAQVICWNHLHWLLERPRPG